LPAAADRKPRTIALKNTPATRVEQMIRGLFRADLAGEGPSKDGGKGPSWLATEILVDDVTNSLIVTGPAPLADDIEQFARSIDDAAGEDMSRELVIVPLKGTNATRVQKVLDTILGQSSGGASSRAASPSGGARKRPAASSASPAPSPAPAPAAAPRPAPAPAAPAAKNY